LGKRPTTWVRRLICELSVSHMFEVRRRLRRKRSIDGYDPEVWLTDVLERLPEMTNRDDLRVLRPSRWQPAAAPAASTVVACTF